jgi:hypothetical protein
MVKIGAAGRIRLGLGPKAWFARQCPKITRNSGRIHDAEFNCQRNWECMTVFYGR